MPCWPPAHPRLPKAKPGQGDLPLVPLSKSSLRQDSPFFDEATIAALSRQRDPRHPMDLRYLPAPVDDPQPMPCLELRPVGDALFLQGWLEGIAAIEAQGWARLQALGAPAVQRVLTVGGGAQNPTWRQFANRLWAALS